MEFLKSKWTYVILILALILMSAAIAYFLFLANERDPYVGGMLVDAGSRMVVL